LKPITAAFVVILALSACKRDEPTSWDLQARVPLAEGRLQWGDLVEDSLLALDQLGVLHVVYEASLVDFDLDTLTTIEDTTISNSYTPGFNGGPIEIPPGTSVLSLSEDMAFGVSTAEIREIHIASGRLNYRLESYVQGELSLSYQLPGVTMADGSSLTINATTQPASDGVPWVEQGFRELNDVEVDLQGSNGGTFNRLASILDVDIAAEAADAVPVYGDDSVRVVLEFTDVRIAYGRGYFGQTQDESVDTLDLSPFAHSEGYLNLDELEFFLEITNRAGADARIELENITATRGNESVDLNHEVIGQQINLTRATDNGDGTVNANSYSWSINQNNSNITDLFSILPEHLVIDRAFELNPLGDVSGGNDFLYVDQPVEAAYSLNLPLAFSSSGVLLQDTLSIDPVESEVEGSGKLLFRLSNGFPLDVASVRLTYHTADGASYAFLNDLSLPAATLDGQQWLASEQLHEQVLTTEHFTALREGGRLEVEVEFSTVDGQQVQMNGNEFIDIEVIGDGIIRAEIE